METQKRTRSIKTACYGCRPINVLWPLPLPLLSHLARSFVRTLRRDPSVLIRPSGYQSSLWLRGGAEALSFICRHIAKNHQKPVRLLLPSYFCGQSLRHLRHDGVEFVFYSLNDDLSPNTSSIEPLIDHQKANLFLHVHYFGLLIQTQGSAEFCQRHGVTLVEDCAHLSSPMNNMKFIGDFLIFSPHKHFPVQYGGLLLARSELNGLENQKQDQLSVSWYLKRLARRYFTKKSFWQRRGDWKITFSDDKVAAKYCSPSPLEIDLVTEKINHPEESTNKRRSNASKITALIDSDSSIQLLTHFQKHDVPYLVGLRFTELSNLQKFVKTLIKSGCPYMMWPDLPAELNVAECDFQPDILRTMLTLFLFVHEDIDINTYTKTIKEALYAAKQ